MNKFAGVLRLKTQLVCLALLKLNAVEYYANEIEDDIEEGIVGGLLRNQLSRTAMKS